MRSIIKFITTNCQ